MQIMLRKEEDDKAKQQDKILRESPSNVFVTLLRSSWFFLFLTLVTSPLKDKKRKPRRNTFSSPVSQNHKFRGPNYHLDVPPL